MHYHISHPDPSGRFLKLRYTIPSVRQDTVHIQLPAWRPGRYELQNYAKNIRGLDIRDRNDQPVAFRKITKDRWEISTHQVDELRISYDYYANQLDAGASYACEEFIYINPSNCMLYMEGRMDEPYTLEFDIPADYRIATQLKPTGIHALKADHFDQLADSPLIASASLSRVSFSLDTAPDATEIHCWFQGNHQLDTGRLEKDTYAYCMEQYSIFRELPCRSYHFLYLMLDHPFRHGVEHEDSTVIAMGRLAEQDEETFYQDLLAISCHEFFHLWNIKRIRPEEMLPYDFTRENYSTLGYVYEGITTYYGDLLLYRSGVWSWEQYAASLCGDLKKHFDNPGRYYYSVAESSFDTWLDGYTQGVPGRKVSIYTEGLIAALIADLMILKNSGGRYRLDDVLTDLYEHTYKAGKGYSEESYRLLLEKYSGISFASYFSEVIWGRGQMEKWLRETLTYVAIGVQTGSEGSVQLQLEYPDPMQLELRRAWMKSAKDGL